MDQTAKQLVSQCEAAARRVSSGELNKDAFIGALTAQLNMLVAQQCAPTLPHDQFESVVLFGEANAIAHFAYEPREPQTVDHPGSPASVELRAFYIKGADIFDALTADQIEGIEENLIVAQDHDLHQMHLKAA